MTRCTVSPLVLLALLGVLPGVVARVEDGDDDLEAEAVVSLLQTSFVFPGAAQASLASAEKSDATGERDLVLVHVPFNFGHSIENVAMFGSGGPFSAKRMIDYVASLGGFGSVSRQVSWSEARRLARPDAEFWGHLNPDLQVLSEVTGCPMYYTPQKYWPSNLAAKYFGNKTVFGMLRDPYERLVAFFRGNNPQYGATHPEFFATCDVNGAVKSMLRDYLAGGKEFAGGCTLLPQAEFFEGPYGITLPINNREFPRSMNEAFQEHGYHDFVINTSDILHVEGCVDVWAADLDAEARDLVKKVYSRDFELLCKHFGYCDREENCCIYQVPQMCPDRVLKMGYRGHSLNATR